MRTTLQILGLAGGMALPALAMPAKIATDSLSADHFSHKGWAPHSSPCWSDDNPSGVRSLEWPDTQYLDPDDMTVEKCLDDVSKLLFPKNLTPWAVIHILHPFFNHPMRTSNKKTKTPSLTRDADLNVSKCASKGFNLAGLEYARECFCGNTIMSNVSVFPKAPRLSSALKKTRKIPFSISHVLTTYLRGRPLVPRRATSPALETLSKHAAETKP